MSMITYSLFDKNQLSVFDRGDSGTDCCFVLFFKGHCNHVYASDITNCANTLLEYYDYNDLVNIIYDFEHLKERAMRFSRSSTFYDFFDTKNLVRVHLSTYLGGFLCVQINKDNNNHSFFEFKDIHINLRPWSEESLQKAFAEAEKRLMSTRNEVISYLIKVVNATKKVCNTEGFYFSDPFKPVDDKKSVCDKRSNPFVAFFKWLFT